MGGCKNDRGVLDMTYAEKTRELYTSIVFRSGIMCRDSGGSNTGADFSN